MIQMLLNKIIIFKYKRIYLLCCIITVFFKFKKNMEDRFSNSQLSYKYKCFLAWFTAITEYDPLICGKSLQGLSSVLNIHELQI